MASGIRMSSDHRSTHRPFSPGGSPLNIFPIFAQHRMDPIFHENKVFEKIVYTGKVIKGREFQQCTFRQCDLSNSDFDHNKFLDCTFELCNLSMMKMRGTTLSNAVFRDCKIMGVNFNDCEKFLFHVEAFHSCILDYSSFMGRKLIKGNFFKTSLKEVNFSQATLTGCVFDQTDMENAIFERTDLTATDFRTAYNFIIDPELNIIRKAKFSLHGLPGLMVRYGIKIE